MVGHVGRDWEIIRFWFLFLKRDFKIQEFFMELIERDQGVTGLDDTNKLFIIITKNYQEFSL